MPISMLKYIKYIKTLFIIQWIEKKMHGETLKLKK